MSITLFGIIWMIVLLLAMMQSKLRLQECVVFSCLFQSGAVFLIGSTSLPPVAFSCLVYIGYYILHKRTSLKLWISKHARILLLFIAVIFLSSLLASVLFVGMQYLASTNWIEYKHYDGNIPIFGMSLILIYIITLILFEQDSYFGELYLRRLMIIMTIFVFVVGVWQYLSIMKIVPQNELIKNILYSNTNSLASTAYYVDTNINKYQSIFSVRFYSSFMEPSYCSGFLIACFAYFLYLDDKKLIDNICTALLILMLLLTFSATAYAGLVIISFFVAISKKNIKRFFAIAGELIMLLLLFWIFVNIFNVWDSIERLVVNKLKSHSGITRAQWNMSSLKVFFDTYGIGLGFGNLRGSGLLQTLFGSFGVFGSFFFLLGIGSILVSRIKARFGEKWGYSRQLGLMIVGVLICQIIAIPTIDYPVFWLTMFISSLSIGNERRKIKC